MPHSHNTLAPEEDPAFAGVTHDLPPRRVVLGQLLDSGRRAPATSDRLALAAERVNAFARLLEGERGSTHPMLPLLVRVEREASAEARALVLTDMVMERTELSGAAAVLLDRLNRRRRDRLHARMW